MPGMLKYCHTPSTPEGTFWVPQCSDFLGTSLKKDAKYENINRSTKRKQAQGSLIKAARERPLPQGSGWKRHCDHKSFKSPWDASDFPPQLHLCYTGLTQRSTCLTKPKASWRDPRALPSVEASNVQPSVGERSTIHTVYKTYRNQSDPRDHVTVTGVLNRYLRKWKWWASGRKWPERRATQLRPCTSGKEILQLPWGILKKEKEPIKTLANSSTLLHSCFL